MEYWYRASRKTAEPNEYVLAHKDNMATFVAGCCSLGDYLNIVFSIDWGQVADAAIEGRAAGYDDLAQRLCERIEASEGIRDSGFADMAFFMSEFTRCSQREASDQEIRGGFDQISTLVNLIKSNEVLRSDPEMLRYVAVAAGVETRRSHYSTIGFLARCEIALRKAQILLDQVPPHVLENDPKFGECSYWRRQLNESVLALRINPTDPRLGETLTATKGFLDACENAGYSVDPLVIGLPDELGVVGGHLADAQAEALRYLSEDPAMRRYEVESLAQFVSCSAASCLELGYKIGLCEECDRLYVKFSSHQRCPHEFARGKAETGKPSFRRIATDSDIREKRAAIAKDKSNYQQRLVKKIELARKADRNSQQDRRLRRLLAGMQAHLFAHMDEYGRLEGITPREYRDWLKAMTEIDSRSFIKNYLVDNAPRSPVYNIVGEPGGPYDVVPAEFDFASYRERNSRGLDRPSPLIDVRDSQTLCAIGTALAERLRFEAKRPLSEDECVCFKLLMESFVPLVFDAADLFRPLNFHKFVDSERSMLGEIASMFERIDNPKCDAAEYRMIIIANMAEQVRNGTTYDGRKKVFVKKPHGHPRPDSDFVVKWDEFAGCDLGLKKRVVEFCMDLHAHFEEQEERGLRKYLDRIAPELVDEVLGQNDAHAI